MPYVRLDAAMAERGIARSRTVAAKLIAGGLVTVNGAPVVKASHRVSDSASIVVASSDHYVSRAAHKLIAAFDGFAVDPAGRLALDVGASTGGFTQVLLERRGRHVIALDVGHGQLVPELRADPRVTVVEGFNARSMTKDALADVSGIAETPGILVADLSFISLPTVLPALLETVGTEADYVLLVKPQFEVGRTGIREGIVRDAGLRADALNGVLWAAWDLGLPTAGVLPSPVAGGSGNREFLVWLSAESGTNPTQWRDVVQGMA